MAREPKVVTLHTNQKNGLIESESQDIIPIDEMDKQIELDNLYADSENAETLSEEMEIEEKIVLLLGVVNYSRDEGFGIVEGSVFINQVGD